MSNDELAREMQEETVRNRTTKEQLREDLRRLDRVLKTTKRHVDDLPDDPNRGDTVRVHRHIWEFWRWREP